MVTRDMIKHLQSAKEETTFDNNLLEQLSWLLATLWVGRRLMETSKGLNQSLMQNNRGTRELN